VAQAPTQGAVSCASYDAWERAQSRFHDEVFVPAISEARARGESSEDIRDSIRREWKPARSTRR
jgi:hypothetical protein